MKKPTRKQGNHVIQYFPTNDHSERYESNISVSCVPLSLDVRKINKVKITSIPIFLMPYKDSFTLRASTNAGVFDFNGEGLWLIIIQQHPSRQSL